MKNNEACKREEFAQGHTDNMAQQRIKGRQSALYISYYFYSLSLMALRAGYGGYHFSGKKCKAYWVYIMFSRSLRELIKESKLKT